LTAFQAQTKRAGYKAARQLARLICMGEAERLALLTTRLVVRRSCGCR